MSPTTNAPPAAERAVIWARWRRVVNSALGSALLAGTLPARADSRIHARWSDHSALSIAPGRVEIGALSMSSYAPSERLELSLHPAAFILLPHFSAKWRWLDRGPWTLAIRQQLTVPTPFLEAVAREGTLGLLPPTEEVPWAVMLDNALLLTHRTGAETFVTVAAGCELSARNHEPVILDFPFLYQRFASLNAAAVPHAAVGVVSNPLPYLDTRLHSTYFWLPLTDFEPGFALESEAQLGLALSDEVRLSVAARWALARYPVGRRTHWLPWLDLRWAW